MHAQLCKDKKDKLVPKGFALELQLKLVFGPEVQGTTAYGHAHTQLRTPHATHTRHAHTPRAHATHTRHARTHRHDTPRTTRHA